MIKNISNPIYYSFKKYIGIICIVFIFLFVFFKQDVNAGELYTAEAVGHYENPVNGEIEDPGNNSGIGEGMVSNTVYGLALVEKDDDGKLFATIRLRRRNHIKDVRMWVQTKGTSGFSEAPVEETKSSGDTGDFRFEIPSTDSVIKSSFFVNQMGRAVIFFITLDNMEEGNTDFKALVSTSASNNNVQSSNSNTEGSSEKNQGEENKSQSSKNSVEKKSEKNKGSKLETENKNKALNKKKEGKKNVLKSKDKDSTISDKESDDKKIEQSELGYDHGLLTNSDFNDNKKKEKEKSRPLGPLSLGIIVFLIVVSAIIFTIFILGAIFVWILYEKTKKENLQIESRFYD